MKPADIFTGPWSIGRTDYRQSSGSISRLETVLAGIRPLEPSARGPIQEHLDELTKPQGSLGRLEEIALRYLWTRGVDDKRPIRARIITFAADHGVAREGVSAYPPEVTAQMVRNFLAGGAAVNAICRSVGAEYRIVDVGVADPLDAVEGLIKRKIAMGTRSITSGPAMSAAQLLEALNIGIELAEQAIDEGVTLLGTGEMGIGNTTASAALMSVLLPASLSDCVGRGTGVDDAGLVRKRLAAARALEVNHARLGSPLEALASLGGFEIAAITGLILAAGTRRIPVLVDGFISSTAALAALRLAPALNDYLFFSHCSAEAGHRRMLESLGHRPILDLEMRLGEGTGAALAVPVLRAAFEVYHTMATFSSAGVACRSSET